MHEVSGVAHFVPVMGDSHLVGDGVSAYGIAQGKQLLYNAKAEP
ncbi:hypothetical protein SNOUR_37765 [Streptomyces noursei ATCC 11455]|nr:hypothetical protein SNOUR_37765 [Streptomyces noursei ATCC 11455]